MQDDTLTPQQQLVGEQEAWFARSADERKQYAGRYVAVYQKHVVDHDADRRTLNLRVRERYGHAPVLIMSADLNEMPDFTLHSPRLRD